ncbi:MAG: hypothetical protein WBL28_01145 [Methylotenera sp.]
MSILNSDWLIRMLEKSSQVPHGRLLNLFDILEDWLEAPSVREQVQNEFSANTPAPLLRDFLTTEAAKAGAAMPEMLANQLYFMAVAAAQEKLQANNHKSMRHAKNAASALISAQTKKEFHITKPPAYAIAASFLAAFIVAGSLFVFNLNQADKEKQIAHSQPLMQAVVTPAAASELTASPEQTAALIAQIELMRHGSCHFPEALQLPDSLKGVYLDIVVNGQISTDPREQKLAFELIKKIQCNYTPILMANSAG